MAHIMAHHGSFPPGRFGRSSGRNFDDPPDGFGGTGGDATNVHEP